MDKWKLIRAADFIDFNPRESVSKGAMAKKVAMEQLQPFTRDIPAFEVAPFNGGSKFRNGDTLMARITPCLENGKTALVNILDNDEVGFGSTEFIVLRAKPGISDKDFVYYLATSPLMRDKAIKSMVGSSGRQRVQHSVMVEMEFLLPPIWEQIEIGCTLRALDDKIANNRAINHHLEQMAQAIFKSWFVDFEPFGGEKPSDWQTGSLADIADYLNGLAMQRFRPADGQVGLPVLKIRELRQGSCDATSELCSPCIHYDYKVHDGDVIFSWSGSLLVDFWCGGDCGLNQHLFKVTSRLYDKWFYYAWTNHYLDRFIAIAADKATTMGHIKREALENAEVLIPTEKDYSTVGDLLTPLYEQVIRNRVENRKLALLRDSLLPRLISGELSVADVDAK
ncbi:MAG TPA: restriction endonuclease subunit S [Anaerolineaceae bacterium]|nr:restriction endonuclease subunit S [Anaerolineaceae bacterium]